MRYLLATQLVQVSKERQLVQLTGQARHFFEILSPYLPDPQFWVHVFVVAI